MNEVLIDITLGQDKLKKAMDQMSEKLLRKYPGETRKIWCKKRNKHYQKHIENGKVEDQDCNTVRKRNQLNGCFQKRVHCQAKLGQLTCYCQLRFHWTLSFNEPSQTFAKYMKPFPLRVKWYLCYFIITY